MEANFIRDFAMMVSSGSEKSGATPALVHNLEKESNLYSTRASRW